MELLALETRLCYSHSVYLVAYPRAGQDGNVYLRRVWCLNECDPDSLHPVRNSSFFCYIPVTSKRRAVFGMPNVEPLQQLLG